MPGEAAAASLASVASPRFAAPAFRVRIAFMSGLVLEPSFIEEFAQGCESFWLTPEGSAHGCEGVGEVADVVLMVEPESTTLEDRARELPASDAVSVPVVSLGAGTGCQSLVDSDGAL